MPDARIVDVLKGNQNSLVQLLSVCTLVAVFACLPLHAQMFQNMHDFNCKTGGCDPVDFGYLTVGEDNNLWGTTYGARGSVATIFNVTPTSPFVYTDVYKFDGAITRPLAGLTLMNKIFYGTTSRGGNSNLGVVFSFTPPSTLTVLYSFTESAPAAAPVAGVDGNLYGITSGGQAYKVTLPAGTVSILPNPAPGDVHAPLFLASDTNLYGTSNNGGANGLGAVFRMSTNGNFDIVHSFAGTDGSGPVGPLTQGSNGNLYGTTQFGGTNGGGVIFEISPKTGAIKTLHSFDQLTDGGTPSAGLLAGSDGLFYGVNAFGGTDDCGTIFQASTGGFFNTLFNFTCIPGPVPGEYPVTTLVAHTNGNFYGLTSYDGQGRIGTIFSLTPPNPLPILILEGPIFVLPGVPVTILGNNLSQVISLSFAGVQAQFQPGSDTFLTATVPSTAVDGLITATLATGLQVQSQGAVHIRPMITNLDPSSGPPGTQVGIVGGGFAEAKKVTFGGVESTSFTVVSPTLIQAIVPTGAKTGKVRVITHNGTATSTETFTVN
jgi:uncharacterized repeat protein (TIGR03803 family)